MVALELEILPESDRNRQSEPCPYSIVESATVFETVRPRFESSYGRQPMVEVETTAPCEGVGSGSSPDRLTYRRRNDVTESTDTEPTRQLRGTRQC
jgi:hypothetical protein